MYEALARTWGTLARRTTKIKTGRKSSAPGLELSEPRERLRAEKRISHALTMQASFPRGRVYRFIRRNSSWASRSTNCSTHAGGVRGVESITVHCQRVPTRCLVRAQTHTHLVPTPARHLQSLHGQKLQCHVMSHYQLSTHKCHCCTHKHCSPAAHAVADGGPHPLLVLRATR